MQYNYKYVTQVEIGLLWAIIKPVFAELFYPLDSKQSL